MIQIQHLTKRFAAAGATVVALNDINLEIQDGDIYGIIGMSGAGKSTLVRCINMLERPDEGKVIVNGREMMQLSPAELRDARREITMIFQQFNLLMQRTCLKNICFPMELAGVGRKEAQAKARQLLELVGLPDKAQAYPAQLSGGQQQRIAIARALATNPKVLLCDEATSALDPNTTHAILQLIQKINREMGITVVIITHQMSVVEDVCSHVAILDNGTVVEQGSVRDIFSNPHSDAAKRLVFPAGTPERELLPGRKMVRVAFNGTQTTDKPLVATPTALPTRRWAAMAEFFASKDWQTFLDVLPSIPAETWDTFYSTVVATLFALVIGLPLGVLLVTGEPGGVRPLPRWVMRLLNGVINLLRSVPFLILMIIVIPLSRLIVGTSIGTVASIVPLVIASFPFVSRLVETSIREVDSGVVEAAQSMGATPLQIITKVLIPESMPSLIANATIAATTILGYGAMAGVIGGGGLGKVAINYGYYRYNLVLEIFATALLVVLVQVLQSIGTRLATRCDKRVQKTKG